MRRTTALALLTALTALTIAAACSTPGPTESRQPTSTRNNGQDSTKKCAEGGMIGSGTVTC
ncbi:MAG TPA: hypothetical protein VFS20_23055 [Longimicrobium sp.]|nr:hypothetical protein [Longimicrobium sp.]